MAIRPRPFTGVLDELIGSQDALNAEASSHSLVGGVAMPTAGFYVRNHFQMPVLDPTTWRLRIGGMVQHPIVLGLRDLLAMPSHTQVVTQECAGNGRSFLNPKSARRPT